MSTIPNLTHLPFSGAETVFDPILQVEINKLITNSIAEGCLYNDNIHNIFVNEYRNWLINSNRVLGLDNFPISAYSNGTTESFDKFYLKYHTCRFRFFKGEYMYHSACGRNYCNNWKFLDDDILQSNDVVVISYPFSDTGDEHPSMIQILDRCYVLGVPVLIDCAFFGLTGDMNIDLTHPAITEVAFSLSKFLPVSHLRIGVRFSKVDDDDTLLISHKHGYVNRVGAGLGLKIFENFSYDYNFLKYREMQIDFCNQLDLKPSKSVIFGVDEKNLYSEYNRGFISNRLCFSKYFHVGKIPNQI